MLSERRLTGGEGEREELRLGGPCRLESCLKSMDEGGGKKGTASSLLVWLTSFPEEAPKGESRASFSHEGGAQRERGRASARSKPQRGLR